VTTPFPDRKRRRPQFSNAVKAGLGPLGALNGREEWHIVFYCCKLSPVVEICLLTLYL